MIEVTIIQFMVALFMSLGALCIFIWAVLSGLFTDMEEIKHRAYRAEVNERVKKQTLRKKRKRKNNHQVKKVFPITSRWKSMEEDTYRLDMAGSTAGCWWFTMACSSGHCIMDIRIGVVWVQVWTTEPAYIN